MHNKLKLRWSGVFADTGVQVPRVGTKNLYNATVIIGAFTIGHKV